MKAIAQWTTFPLIVILGVFQFFWILQWGPQYLEIATTVPMLYIMGACMYMERAMPYDLSWRPLAADWKMDTMHLVFFQTILPKGFKAIVLILALRWIPRILKS